MRYLLIALLTFISVFPLSAKVKKWRDFIGVWGCFDIKSVGCWLALLIGGYAAFDLWDGDLDAEKKWEAEVDSNKELRVGIEDATNKLQNAYLKIAEQEAVIGRLSRSLSAISYSTRTSYAGKERFLKNFKELARVAKIDCRMTGFEGLICEDGVALFWFDSRTESITGFYFFRNDEINRILNGRALGKDFITKDGRMRLDKNQELSIAFEESLFKRMPNRSENLIESESVKDEIFGGLKTLLRYVYRAEGIRLKSICTTDRKATGEYSLEFRYAVNPLAKERKYRSISIFDVVITKGFIDSLYGLTNAEFSEKVIEYLRSKKVEPKIMVRDIRMLGQMRQDKEWQKNSPYNF